MADPVAYNYEDTLAQPPSLFPGYASTIKRAPSQKPVRLPHTLTEVTGPTVAFDGAGPGRILRAPCADLTRVAAGEPLGERIIVTGRVLDEDARPVPNTVVEIWQANSAGRYIHARDQHPAPLDPNFVGEGRFITDDQGFYRFVTIKPGAYPWLNHYNAWRPAHIHFSLFGPSFATRLVTQMYFPGDPLIPIDPIACSIPEPARSRMVSRFDIGTTEPEWALGYSFDIVLRGRDATPMED